MSHDYLLMSQDTTNERCLIYANHKENKTPTHAGKKRRYIETKVKKIGRATKRLAAVHLRHLALVVGNLNNSRTSNRVVISDFGVGAGEDDVGLSIDATRNQDVKSAIGDLGLNKYRS